MFCVGEKGEESAEGAGGGEENREEGGRDAKGEQDPERGEEKSERVEVRI